MLRTLASSMLLAACLLAPAVAAEPVLHAGFAEADITPDPNGERSVWLAGYGLARKAKGVHDPLMARCVVLSAGDVKMALVSVDLIGFQYPHVLKIRERLDDFDYVMVSSTHNHEGPDVIGIWGPTPIHRGVDDKYIELVIDRVVGAVQQAAESMQQVRASYGTAEDESLVRDSRKPYVKDGVLRAVRLESVDGKTAGALVQWNCHPEAMGPHNRQITADFVASTVAELQKRYECPVVYFGGAVGGLLAPPRDLFKGEDGRVLGEGDFQYAQAYGEAVAELAASALENTEPIELSPLAVYARQIALPVENPWYRLARAIGVLKRKGRVWTGDFNNLGEPVTAENADQPSAIVTEVAYLKLGELHVACIPGEIYPELVYGKIQEPIDPGADHPDAPREPAIVEILQDPRWMLFGLANDEIGYIIPKRQWDAVSPFAYGRDRGQYGEINSCGAQAGPVIMQAFAERVAEARQPAAAARAGN